MDIQQSFVSFALGGAEWVMWLLVGLSIVSIAVIVERTLFYARRRVDVDALLARITSPARRGDVMAGLPHDALECGVASVGLRRRNAGAAGASEAMNAEMLRLRERYERGLPLLATLGNNAPFVGLFGTVLGIIRAFHDLAVSGGGASAVMAGISDALVATAIGLGVALPAVAAFNAFQQRANRAFDAAVRVSAVIASTPELASVRREAA